MKSTKHRFNTVCQFLIAAMFAVNFFSLQPLAVQEDSYDGTDYGLFTPYSGNIITVPGDYNTIKAAAEAAGSGDTVLVGGLHTEPQNTIIIDKDITISAPYSGITLACDKNLAGPRVTVNPGCTLTLSDIGSFQTSGAVTLLGSIINVESGGGLIAESVTFTYPATTGGVTYIKLDNASAADFNNVRFENLAATTVFTLIESTNTDLSFQNTMFDMTNPRLVHTIANIAGGNFSLENCEVIIGSTGVVSGFNCTDIESLNISGGTISNRMNTVLTIDNSSVNSGTATITGSTLKIGKAAAEKEPYRFIGLDKVSISGAVIDVGPIEAGDNSGAGKNLYFTGCKNIILDGNTATINRAGISSVTNYAFYIENSGSVVSMRNSYTSGFNYNCPIEITSGSFTSGVSGDESKKDTFNISAISSKGAVISNADGVSVHHARVDIAGDTTQKTTGFLIKNSNNILFDNTDMSIGGTNYSYECVQVAGCTNLKMVSPKFTINKSISAAGLRVKDEMGALDPTYNHTVGISITNPVIIINKYANSSVGISLHTAKGVTIAGLTGSMDKEIYSSSYISLTNERNSALKPTELSIDGAEISGCTFNLAGERAAGVSGGGIFSEHLENSGFYSMRGVTIKNCNFYVNGDISGQSNRDFVDSDRCRAITLTRVSDIDIHDNTIEVNGFYCSGISVGSSTSSKVHDNNITGFLYTAKNHAVNPAFYGIIVDGLAIGNNGTLTSPYIDRNGEYIDDVHEIYNNTLSGSFERGMYCATIGGKIHRNDFDAAGTGVYKNEQIYFHCSQGISVHDNIFAAASNEDTPVMKLNQTKLGSVKDNNFKPANAHAERVLVMRGDSRALYKTHKNPIISDYSEIETGNMINNEAALERETAEILNSTDYSFELLLVKSFTVELTKLGENGVALPGTKFSLEIDGVPGAIAVLTTDNSGKAAATVSELGGNGVITTNIGDNPETANYTPFFGNSDVRTLTLTETSAPQQYSGGIGKTYSFTIRKQDMGIKVIAEIQAESERKFAVTSADGSLPGKLTLTAVNNADNTPVIIPEPVTTAPTTTNIKTTDEDSPTEPSDDTTDEELSQTEPSIEPAAETTNEGSPTEPPIEPTVETTGRELPTEPSIKLIAEPTDEVLYITTAQADVHTTQKYIAPVPTAPIAGGGIVANNTGKPVPDNLVPTEIEDIYVSFDENGVPLGYFKMIQNEDDTIEWIEVDEMGIPLAALIIPGVTETETENTNGNESPVPETGDGTAWFILIFALCTSGFISLVYFIYEKVFRGKSRIM